jgi:hypothetical protein
MGRAGVLQGVRQMRFEALLEKGLNDSYETHCCANLPRSEHCRHHPRWK